MEADDTVVNTRGMWAEAERQLGNHAEAARLGSEILDRVELDDEDAPRHLWQALVNGTLAADWALVRRACTHLGIAVEGDVGPIDELWEWILITFRTDDGGDETVTAHRTGPATARVVSVAPPGEPQRHGDCVVFDPVLLDPIPDDPEEAARTLRRYPALITSAEAGATSWSFEGAVVDDQWFVLRDGLRAAGFTIWSHGGPMIDLPDGREAEAIWASIATLPDQTPVELATALDELTSTWDPQPCWPDLAEAAGRDPAPHRDRLAELWAG